jgi:transposase
VQRVVHLEEQLRLERLHRYAPRSEKLTERIFNEAEQAAAEGEETDDAEAAAMADTGLPDAEEREPKKRGRKPLPEDLPRERVEHDLPEDQKACPCCRNRMHRMGETVSEQLHIEVKATVLQHVRFKYACRHCERTALHTPIVTAPMPAQPPPGSVATPSTLALVLANKYVDGTPLYRLEQALARANVSISRGALANWVIRSVDLHLLRLYEHPQAFLGDYRGLLMSDGYDAWRTLGRRYPSRLHGTCSTQVHRRAEGEKETRWPSVAGAQVLRGPVRGQEIGTANAGRRRNARRLHLASETAAQPAGIGRLQDMAR